MATKKEVQEIRETVERTGEFRVHMKYGRSGNVTAHMWHHDGLRMAIAGGGGYDKYGAVLGDTIAMVLGAELFGLKLPQRNEAGNFERGELYGLCEFNGKRTLDGACGYSAMLKVLQALGFTTESYQTGRDAQMIVAKRAGVHELQAQYHNRKASR